MNPQIIPPYKFMRGEGGIFVELYLPKKPSFQGTLYDTLVKGFQIQEVRSHFRSDKAPGIKAMLERFKTSVRFFESDAEIAAFPSVFRGYSVYEVDGVFYNTSKNEIQNERTQVIRIMFRPDLARIIQKYKHDDDAVTRINRTAKAYLRSPKTHDEIMQDPELDEIQREVANYLDTWSNYVGLFLFGFIVYEICEQITRLCARGEMKWDDAEDELWVTSFWNLTINPITLVSVQRRRPLRQSQISPRRWGYGGGQAHQAGLKRSPLR